MSANDICEQPQIVALLKERAAIAKSLQEADDNIRRSVLLVLAECTGIRIGGLAESSRGVYRVTAIEVYTDSASIGQVFGRKRTKSGWHSKIHWIGYSVGGLKAVKE